MSAPIESQSKYKTIDSFTRQFPDMPVRKWEYVDKNNIDVITVYTDTEKFVLGYNYNTKQCVIISREKCDIDGIELQVAEETVVVEEEATPKGRVSGFFAMLLTVLYAIRIISHFGGLGMDSLTGYIANAIVMPHMLCVAIAAAFSLVGFFGKKRWAMLTSGILMAASAVLMTMYAQMVIVQTILFFISYARMGKK